MLCAGDIQMLLHTRQILSPAGHFSVSTAVTGVVVSAEIKLLQVVWLQSEAVALTSVKW